MFRLLLLLVTLLAAATGRAQERRIAIVELENGTTVEGRVVRMDVEQLEILVDGELRTIAATGIRSCRFSTSAEAKETPQGPAPTPTTAVAPTTAGRVEVPAGAVLPPNLQDPAKAHPAANTTPPMPAGSAVVEPDVKTPPAAGAAGGQAPPADAKQPPAAPAGEGATAPKAKPPVRRTALPLGDDEPPQVRLRSRLRERLELLDHRYPWLVPAVPTQWISISLLLFAFLSLVVHLSTKVVGCEAASFGRSMGVSLWYMLTGFLQVAMVPVSDMSVAIMLIANTALALFWLRNLFALSRGGTVVALAVQLGFGVLAFGILELVNVLLATVETA